MVPSDLAKYTPLVEEALAAFRQDFSYSEDMARQASALLARRVSRQESLSVSRQAA